MSRDVERGTILGIETSCDETAAAVVVGGQQRAARRSCRARSTSTPATAASCPRSPAGPTSSCSRRSIAEALVEAGLDDGEVDAVAATVGPGPGRLAAGRRGGGQGAGAGVGRAVRGVNHLEAHLYAALPRGPRPRAAGGRAARVGRPHAARAHGGPRPLPGARARRSTTPPARRSTRSPATSASATPAGPAIDRIAMEGDPDGHRLPPGACSTRATTSRSRASRRRSINHVRKHPDVGHRRRGRLVPGGGGRRAGGQGPPGGRRRSGPRACASAAGWPPTRCCGSAFLDAVRGGRPAGLPARAGRCAPTTRPWWRPPAGGGSRPTAPARSTPAPSRTSALDFS